MAVDGRGDADELTKESTRQPSRPRACYVPRAVPFKVRNGRLTIPAHRLRDLLQVVIIAYKPSLGASGGFFVRGPQMNCQAFTNDSLTMLYEAIRGALAADDALTRQGLAIRFRVRETPDWKKHAADLESEMLKRGMRFDVIDWSEDQPLH